MIKKRIKLICVMFFISLNLYAQQEKRYIRDGNKQFKKEHYSEAEVEFLRALNIDSLSYSATYNLGATLYKQGRFDEAIRVMGSSVKLDSLSPHYAAATYNLANAHLKKRALNEAIEEYKSSLRVNPTDTLAKKNLAYAQKLLEDQQNDDQNDQDNQDNQDNQDQQDNQDNQDQQQDQDNQDQDQDQNNQDQQQDQNNQDQQNQPQDNKMSKEQAEQLLNAIQKSEDNTQEKVNEKKAIGVATKSGKNW